MAFEIILFVLVIYELVAIQTNRVPTITETLKSLPWWVSALVILLLLVLLIDHVYYQWVVP